MGKALGGGSGWVLLTFQPREGTLVNQWAADHTHALAGGVPILALDMYEHAYHLDFGAAAGAYVDAFMANIDWAAVYARYQAGRARGQRVVRRRRPDDVARRCVLDVRRAGVFEQAPTMLPGAQLVRPGRGRPLGGASCRRTATSSSIASTATRSGAARRCGCARPASNARYLRGGIDGWKAAGHRRSPSRPGWRRS